MHQYLPFPLSHDLSSNHTVTPSVWLNDVLAHSGYETYKIVSQFETVAKWGKLTFAKGEMISAKIFRKLACSYNNQRIFKEIANLKSNMQNIIRVFNETHSILNLSLFLHPHPLLCLWIHSQRHHDHVTSTPKQNHIHVQIKNLVLAIVSSVINLSSLEQQVLLILHWNWWQRWLRPHTLPSYFRTRTTATSKDTALLSSHFRMR